MGGSLCTRLNDDVFNKVIGFTHFDDQINLRFVSRHWHQRLNHVNRTVFDLFQLSALITTGHDYNVLQIQKLQNLTKRYRLHPLFIDKLPFWIRDSWNLVNVHIFGNEVSYSDFGDILDSLNTHSIGISDLNIGPLSKIPVEHQILVLVSRGLLQYLAPTLTMLFEVHGEPELESVTWMSTVNDFRWVPFFIDLYWTLMTDHLNITDVRTLCYLPNSDWRKRKILELMDHCGLIIWNERITASMHQRVYREAHDWVFGTLFTDYVQYESLFFMHPTLAYFPNTTINSSKMLNRFMLNNCNDIHD